MKTYTRGFAHLFLIIVFIVLGLGIMLYSFLLNGRIKQDTSINQLIPSSSPGYFDHNEGWETYINHKYGYALKFKSDKKLIQQTCGDRPDKYNGEEVFILTDLETSSSSLTCYPVEGVGDIQILASEGNTASLEEIYKSYQLDSYEVVPKTLSVENQVVYVFKPKYKLESESGLVPYWTEARVFNERRNLTYYLYLGSEDFKESFDEILTTFKFLPEQCTSECPQFVPPHTDSCKGGKLVNAGLNECGCQLPPRCVR